MGIRLVDVSEDGARHIWSGCGHDVVGTGGQAGPSHDFERAFSLLAVSAYGGDWGRCSDDMHTQNTRLDSLGLAGAKVEMPMVALPFVLFLYCSDTCPLPSRLFSRKMRTIARSLANAILSTRDRQDRPFWAALCIYPERWDQGRQGRSAIIVISTAASFVSMGQLQGGPLSRPLPALPRTSCGETRSSPWSQ